VEVGWGEEKKGEFYESGESKLDFDPSPVFLLCCNVNKNGQRLPQKSKEN